MTNTLNIIFHDNAILVIEKPSGLITISDNAKEETVATLVQKQFNIHPDFSIVHRLDKDTSGVMVIAKTRESHERLQTQFKDRKVKKEYTALVHGMVEKAGIVDVSLTRIPGGGNRFVADEGGRLASTEYKPDGNFQFTISNLQLIFSDLNKPEIKKLQTSGYNNFTLVKCFPLTGRTHQIRVHLKYINHPIVADPLYVGRKNLKLDNYWCPRLFLHAGKIGFYHPVSDKWMEFKSVLPEDLEKVLKKING